MTKPELVVAAGKRHPGEPGSLQISTFGLPSDSDSALREHLDFCPEMPRLLKIAVMLGGPSAEREVSLRSGAQAAAALRSLGHTVLELDPRENDWKLPAGTDVVFLALHGTYGEDGTVQGQLDELAIPSTGCSAEASRIAFDKVLTKQRCVAAG